MKIRSFPLFLLVAALCTGSADARMCERFTTDLGCVNRCMMSFIICKSTAVSGAAAAACQAGYDACRSRCRVCAPDPFAGTAALGTLGLGLVNATPGQTLALMACLLAAGIGVNGVQVQMYTVAASAYPTQLRATGVGWALGTARLGGVLSAFAGSVVQAVGSGLMPFFTGIAAVIVVTFVGIGLLRRHLPAPR